MKSKQNDFVKKDLPLIDQLGFEKKTYWWTKNQNFGEIYALFRS